MHAFSLQEDLFCLHMSSGVECFDTIVESVDVPDYCDESKILFFGISYLKLNISGPIESIIEVGSIKNNDVVLDYSGGWWSFDNHQIPAGFVLEIICKDIELEFFGNKLSAINNKLSFLSRLSHYLKNH